MAIEGDFQSGLDGYLIDAYGVKTANEIALETGLSPQAVNERWSEIFDQVDIITIEQRIQKLGLQLERQAADANERAKNASNRDYAAILNSGRAAITTQLNSLTKALAAIKIDEQALANARVNQLVEIVRDSYYQMLGRLQERYPGVDQASLREEFNELLSVTAAQYDSEALGNE